jgi:hypothetical protein
VVAKVEWHPGELYPTVGFIVTNLSRLAERVVAFYNHRGTAEHWIEKGKTPSRRNFYFLNIFGQYVLFFDWKVSRF